MWNWCKARLPDYGLDANTSAARKFIEANSPRLPLAFSALAGTGEIFLDKPSRKRRKTLGLGQGRCGRGQKLYPLELEADLVAKRAAGLISNFCPRWKKLRSLDALHVAAAVAGNFKTFVSFDTRSFQRVLAATQKLKVWPPLTAEENQFLK